MPAMRTPGLEALVVEADPLIAAFIEDVLLGRHIATDCIVLPGRFDYLLRRHYDVAVLGVDTECRYLPMVVEVLRRRRIPALLFSVNGNLAAVAAEFPYIPTCCYDPGAPEILADYVLRVAARDVVA
ncbi:hypothetical protein VQ042_14440 [Aurantimonas sp. A2-1-M11]|uniref:hypothetical protein n=1 Tax=Aurantimonas sp. A2-1-M11 TaxID=3113712 RepID=UPI002F930B2C